MTTTKQTATKTAEPAKASAPAEALAEATRTSVATAGAIHTVQAATEGYSADARAAAQAFAGLSGTKDKPAGDPTVTVDVAKAVTKVSDMVRDIDILSGPGEGLRVCRALLGDAATGAPDTDVLRVVAVGMARVDAIRAEVKAAKRRLAHREAQHAWTAIVGS